MSIRVEQGVSVAKSPRGSFVLAVALVALASGCSSSGAGLAPLSDSGGTSSSATSPVKTGAADASRDATSHPDASTADASADAANDGASSDVGADAGSDVDNGAPSAVFPAPHPALPTLTNQSHGPVLTSPKVYLVFYPGYPYVADLQKFAANMTTTTYWGEVTAEYGIGPLAYGGTITLTGETPPTTISSVDIGPWVAAELASGAFGTPDPEGIYTIFYPQSTTVTQPNPVLPSLAPVQSCVAFGGYHDNTSTPLTDGGVPTNFAYAVIPTCSTFVDDLTAVLSHEWVEASTDPLVTSSGSFTLSPGPDSAFFTVDPPHAIWALLNGGEAGDLCEPEGQSAYITPADIGYTVQRTWSNKLAVGSHDPCAPNLPGMPYFNAAPVLPETITIMSELIGGTIVTDGITIPAGASKTIEVDLFSDASTDGPFTVTAADALYTYYGSYGLPNTLAFAWDRTSGQNGEKLHLTITVTRESLFDGVHAFVLTSTSGGRQTVWPGLVIE